MKKWRRCLEALLFLLLLAALFALGKRGFTTWKQKRQEEELRELSRQQETAAERELVMEEETEGETELLYESPIDFDALREINPDIVAWVEIPGTRIDYPVVQTDDNETYLHRSFEGGESSAGAIYLDCDSDSDFMGRHSVLYGHHMKNGSMFAEIVKFKEKSFFQEHREVILYLPDRELHLRTIAALYGDAGGEKRRTVFADQESFNRYVDEMTKNCSFRELPEGNCECLYSFVTCSYEFENARTILYAVREEETDAE
ncbi:MAG: class B sortase [Clostridiaceae bacterium]|nr:class B sortase [Clostridiaceae bacterium]MDD6074295.1 class B sortase [Clostridium sp.]